MMPAGPPSRAPAQAPQQSWRERTPLAGPSSSHLLLTAPTLVESDATTSPANRAQTHPTRHRTAISAPSSSLSPPFRPGPSHPRLHRLHLVLAAVARVQDPRKSP